MGERIIKELTNVNFDEEVFESDMLTMVFFGAQRCDVCMELLPNVEELAKEFKDKINVYRIEVDTYKTLAKRMRLRGIPTLAFFKNGIEQKKIGGLQSKETLRRFINELL